MENPLKFVLVGCGRIAHRHAGIIKKVGNLLALCDTDSVKVNQFAKEFGATPYSHIDHLLENEKEIDVVSICTPNGLHAEHTIKSLKAGEYIVECERYRIKGIPTTAYQPNEILGVVRLPRGNRK